MGSLNRDELVWYETTEARTHESFEANTLNNNLAILILPQAIEITAAIAPATMPTNAQNLYPTVGHRGRVTGFGFLDITGGFATVLKVGFQNVISNTDCAAIWTHITPFSANVFCTSSAEANICAGDQGSGLTIHPTFDTILVGVASFTSGTCDHVNPAVYIRVNSYRTWIEGVTGVNWQ